LRITVGGRIAQLIDRIRERKKSHKVIGRAARQAASNLLGHEHVKTTQRHYLRCKRIIPPTKYHFAEKV
jgi:hypothetical protein